MPKVDPQRVQAREGSSYPHPFSEPCLRRRAERLGDAVGLTQFGVNMVTLPPGAWASQRHWHAHEDEFVYVLEGELVLVEDEGEVTLHAGDSAGWPAGVKNGHHLINRSQAEARFLVVGSRNDADFGEYPDIDLKFGTGRYAKGGGVFTHKDGRPY